MHGSAIHHFTDAFAREVVNAYRTLQLNVPAYTVPQLSARWEGTEGEEEPADTKSEKLYHRHHPS